MASSQKVQPSLGSVITILALTVGHLSATWSNEPAMAGVVMMHAASDLLARYSRSLAVSWVVPGAIMAPHRMQAVKVIHHSIFRGSTTMTTSPWPIPWDLNTLASCLEALLNS